MVAGIGQPRRRDRLLRPLTLAFRIRRSEVNRAARTAGLAVVLGWAMYCAFNVTQAVFLERAGVGQYPVFFLLLALAVWPVAGLQSYLGRRLGAGRGFRVSLLGIAALGVAMFIVYSRTEAAPVVLGGYLAYSVAFEMAMLQFWSFVSQHFNLLEGKRILPVIAGGSSVGYLLAGSTSTVVATLWYPELLLLIWSLGCAVAGLMTYQAGRHLFRPPLDWEADEFAAESSVRRTGPLTVTRDALRLLRSSPLVLWMVAAATLLLLAMRVSDYVVAVIFVRSTHGLQELSVLIGTAWSVSYVVQLALAVLVTPVLLSRAGVKNAILVLPVATLAGFLAVAAVPALAASLALFLVRNGLQTGVDDPAENILMGALPDQVAPRLKFLLDVVAIPGSALLAGLVIVIEQGWLSSTPGRAAALVGAAVSILLLVAASRVRGLYLQAIYARLRSHAVSLGDLESALGRPGQAQVGELRALLGDADPEVRQLAAAALGKLAPEAFVEVMPRLAGDSDPGVRKIAFQMIPAAALDRGLLDAAARDGDPWVVASAAVKGRAMDPPWALGPALLTRMAASKNADHAAAAVWAAAALGDQDLISRRLEDPRRRVRLEAIRSFARMKADVAGAADPLINCIRDSDVEVRREALQQAIRWAPPAGDVEAFAGALVESLTSPDQVTRRLAAEALAVQAPGALDRAVPLLYARTETAAATIEALLRSGRPDLVSTAEGQLQSLLQTGRQAARQAARLRELERVGGEGAEDLGQRFLRITLEDHQGRVAEIGLAAMRALHGKSGFHTVERGIDSEHRETRVEALETLLNFGPSWLARPLAVLFDPEAYESGGSRAVTGSELALLADHPDLWVRRGAEAVRTGGDESVKDLVSLKRVPLFATLTLDQLASIDRLMVTRRYLKGEAICRQGEMTSEMYVIQEGSVRVHRQDAGPSVTLARLGPSDHFGEMSLFDDRPRSADVTAITDCVARVLRKDRLKAIVHEHPEVLLAMIRNLSQRLREADERLEGALRGIPPPPTSTGLPSVEM